VGVDNDWEQDKLKARKILENAAESHTSTARFVGLLCLDTLFFFLGFFTAAPQSQCQHQ